MLLALVSWFLLYALQVLERASDFSVKIFLCIGLKTASCHRYAQVLRTLPAVKEDGRLLLTCWDVTSRPLPSFRIGRKNAQQVFHIDLNRYSRQAEFSCSDIIGLIWHHGWRTNQESSDQRGLREDKPQPRYDPADTATNRSWLLIGEACLQPEIPQGIILVWRNVKALLFARNCLNYQLITKKKRNCDLCNDEALIAIRPQASQVQQSSAVSLKDGCGVTFFPTAALVSMRRWI